MHCSQLLACESCVTCIGLYTQDMVNDQRLEAQTTVGGVDAMDLHTQVTRAPMQAFPAVKVSGSLLLCSGWHMQCSAPQPSKALQGGMLLVSSC